MASAPFWEVKSLAEMTTAEWEALCDGCGKCCLHKLVNDYEVTSDEAGNFQMHADEELHFTSVRCQYLDPANARCQCYSERLSKVANCVNITLADLPQIHYMPASCAYRRLHEGKSLPSWHPLRHDGDQTAMRAAGMSVVNQDTRSEADVSEHDFEDYIVLWPLNSVD